MRKGDSLEKFDTENVPSDHRKVTACFHIIIFEKKGMSNDVTNAPSSNL
jgi:hypothetical protein